MSYYKIKFLTLNSNQIKDSLYAVSILSQYNGKLVLKINGAGKPKSRFSNLNSPGLLCFGLTYLSRENGNLTLTDVEIINEYSHLKTNSSNLQAISYISIFLSSILPEKMRIKGMLDSVDFFFKHSDCIRILDINLFRFYVLRALGYLPELKECMQCGRLLKNANAFVEKKNCEIICSACSGLSINSRLEISSGFIEYYSDIHNSSYDIENLLQNKKSEKFQIMLESFLEIYIMSILESDNKKYIFFKKCITEL